MLGSKSLLLAFLAIAAEFSQVNASKKRRAATCGGVAGLIETALKDYAPATSYCSSKYPLAPKTTLQCASRSTVTVTETATTTTIAPVITSTSIIDITSTETDLETDTVVVTAIAPTITDNVVVTVTKRDVEATIAARNDPRVAQWSSFLQKEATVIASICSCIEVRQTVTKTSSPTPTTITFTTTSTVVSSLVTVLVETETDVSSMTATSLITVTTTPNAVTQTLTATSTTSTTPAISAVALCTYTQANYGFTGVGGCPSNCYCDLGSSGTGRCDDASSCSTANTACTSDSQCASGQSCISGLSCHAGGTCADYLGCLATSKRMMVRREEGMSYLDNRGMGEAKRVEKRGTAVVGQKAHVMPADA